jgi:SAM-dependent methyltransferase/glycosyltransferase involved in cell wall biosynthesis
MDICIAVGGMPFGPDTLQTKSLGGSETAAISLARALRAHDHNVTIFCLLPEPGQADHFPSGAIHSDGVRYMHASLFLDYAGSTEHDLSIVVRDPAFLARPVQAKKTILWMHDIATKRGMQRAFDATHWTFDEVWTVSEWHRQQVFKTTGYPLSHIFAIRNGIIKTETVPMGRSKTSLLYASRPERGLDNLIRPGGIMDHLPEFQLQVCMYAHFPEHMRDYYSQIMARMKEMPNVEFIGSKTQVDMRQLVSAAAGYIYPTQFEETSCILARECIEQGTPFLSTRMGALPETLGDCGLFFEDWLQAQGITQPEKGSDGWCYLFAQFVRITLNNNGIVSFIQNAMSKRTDIYWDGVADDILSKHIEPAPVTVFSRAWSMVQDGDVIPARAFLEDRGLNTEPERLLFQEITECYRFLLPKDNPAYISLADHYEWIYSSKAGKDNCELHFTPDFVQGGRYQYIAKELSTLPAGSRILEFGCGSGHILAALAKHLPQHKYYGVEFAPSAVKCLNEGAAAAGLTNVRAYVGDDKAWPKDVSFQEAATGGFDAVILSEVLEHVIEPWTLLQFCEKAVRPGGRVMITVPFGPWEQGTFHVPGRWFERAHIWLLDQWMLRKMIGSKLNRIFSSLQVGVLTDLRPFGNLYLSYEADHTPILPIDPLEKARESRSRQTCAAAVIAYNNEDTIVKMLNGLDKKVQFVQFALGPCTDNTRPLIEHWFKEHPWMHYNIIDVPKIEAYKFGFDDARNISVRGLEESFDWILWIDTDEFLSGDPRRYFRNNCLDGYLVPQHHFTVMPREAPAQMDRPARLFKSGKGYKAKGHIHEHFEIPEGGPGRCFQLPDVDLAHSGYVNEDVRQERFQRNFPFLEWDHKTEEGQGRKLHHFLWLRDIIHRMRFFAKNKNSFATVSLAKEAVSYYNAHWEDMAAFGPGMFYSLGYVGEAYSVLGMGTPLKVSIAFDDRSTEIVGRFVTYDQVQRVLKTLIEPELKDRMDQYY